VRWNCEAYCVPIHQLVRFVRKYGPTRPTGGVWATSVVPVRAVLIEGPAQPTQVQNLSGEVQILLNPEYGARRDHNGAGLLPKVGEGR
jgi:hypothetical protein